jgi:hypothetical protein
MLSDGNVWPLFIIIVVIQIVNLFLPYPSVTKRRAERQLSDQERRFGTLEYSRQAAKFGTTVLETEQRLDSTSTSRGIAELSSTRSCTCYTAGVQPADNPTPPVKELAGQSDCTASQRS